jgi:hypothetical protein
LLEQKINHEKELSKFKNEQIKKLEENFTETNKYLLEQKCSKNSVVNKSYNLQFNTLKDKINSFFAIADTNEKIYNGC